MLIKLFCIAVMKCWWGWLRLNHTGEVVKIMRLLRLKSGIAIIGPLAVLFMLFGAQSLTAQEPEPKVDEEVCVSYINMFCTRCHTPDRLCKALGTKNEEQWRQTVRKMAEYDRLDQDIQSVVFSCLADRKPGDPLVCGEK